jgi:hypothetical protein
MPALNPAIAETNVRKRDTPRETWLKPNRRAILFACVPPFVLAMIGVWLALQSEASSRWPWLGIAFSAMNVGLLLLLVRQLWRPRIAFHGGKVLFYLRGGFPIAVPVDVVEAFFAGQSPAHLPGLTKQPKTVNLIARLSRRHTEWAERDVKPSLGQWCDSYVTIRGTWCEPLNAEIIRRLNRRLKEVNDDKTSGQ